MFNHSFTRKSIKEHEETRDPNSPRDFIDVYLAEMERGRNPNFDQEGLELTCLDLFKVGGVGDRARANPSFRQFG